MHVLHVYDDDPWTQPCCIDPTDILPAFTMHVLGIVKNSKVACGGLKGGVRMEIALCYN